LRRKAGQPARLLPWDDRHMSIRDNLTIVISDVATIDRISQPAPRRYRDFLYFAPDSELPLVKSYEEEVIKKILDYWEALRSRTFSCLAGNRRALSRRWEALMRLRACPWRARLAARAGFLGEGGVNLFGWQWSCPRSDELVVQ